MEDRPIFLLMTTYRLNLLFARFISQDSTFKGVYEPTLQEWIDIFQKRKKENYFQNRLSHWSDLQGFKLVIFTYTRTLYIYFLEGKLNTLLK